MVFEINPLGNTNSVYGKNVSNSSTSNQFLNTVWGDMPRQQKQDDNRVKVIFNDDGSYEKMVDVDGDGKPDQSITMKDDKLIASTTYSYGQRTYHNLVSGEDKTVNYATLEVSHIENDKITSIEEFIHFEDGRKVKTQELVCSEELDGDFVYQMYYDSETALPINSVELYTSKDNVPQKWIGLEKEEVLYDDKGKPKEKIVHTYTTDQEGYLKDNPDHINLGA